jgi:transcriptional activator SPT7
MSSVGNHHLVPNHTHPHGTPTHPLHFNGLLGGLSRSRTPNPAPSQSSHSAPEPEVSIEDDPRSLLFKDLFARSEDRLDALFAGDGAIKEDETRDDTGPAGANAVAPSAEASASKPPPKKAARTIDEDDYDDDDDEEDTTSTASPLKSKSTGSHAVPRVTSPQKAARATPTPAPNTSAPSTTAAKTSQSSEDARKKLEEEKKAAEEAAKQSFQTLFHPLDNDRDAMLEQQRLEESDRQVDAEMSGNSAGANANAAKTLSQVNLGTSSLVLKHLIARIDLKRAEVSASDQELRNLMVEVKRNRSKWANEDKIGQEDLYEAAEKVLSDIKAMTEHSQPFLQRVNKREAPDYYNIIKHPMDLSTMTKKLKAIQYKSKKEFVDDLNLIWANCLKYNANPEHFLRKHALAMRKETEKLVPLIPDIVIRDRAEVEAEERRREAAEQGGEGAEDSDDEPIIASRGRKAPGKTAKKGAATAQAEAEGTPHPESKPLPNGVGAAGRHDLVRAESDSVMEGSQNGFNTPPPGTITPAGHPAQGSQADAMEIDGMGINGTGHLDDPDYEDPAHKIWKQVTKKDRALHAAERHRLFKGDKLNPEEPALLRSKAGMRRWLKMQRDAGTATVLGKRKRETEDDGKEEPPARETLAEGMEGEGQDRVLPDYYDTMNAIPDIEERLQWKEDSEGFVVPTSEETLRVVPGSFFQAPAGSFVQRLHANLRQMQETRKICAKIGIVRQMQIQAQMYQNQFQKYDPHPLADIDGEAAVVSDDGPITAPGVARAAMQRAVSKIFFAAGFEECQPSALESITDLATDYFVKLGKTLSNYLNVPRVPVVEEAAESAEAKVAWKPKYTIEESILQTLWDNGIELESLESYVKEDTDRVTNKLSTLHERMKAHLAELLRPALSTEGGPAGDREFHDGSEQFIGGDFAEELQEDFFGFKELGLDKEFGLGVSVPLHLLQNRMHTAYQSQNTQWAASFTFSMSLLIITAHPIQRNRHSRHPIHSTPSPPSPSSRKLGSCRSSSRTSFMRTATSRSSRTKTCRRSSVCQNRGFPQQARSHHPARNPCGSLAPEKVIRRRNGARWKGRGGSKKASSSKKKRRRRPRQ